MALRSQTLETIVSSEGLAVQGKAETAHTGGELRGRPAGAELLFLSDRAIPARCMASSAPAPIRDWRSARGLQARE